MTSGPTLDRATVLGALPGELVGFAALLRSLDGSALAAPTRCAGWSVGDVAGHVVGIVADLAAGRLDGQGSPEVTARQARERRGRAAPELAAELDAATPGLMALLRSIPAEGWDGPSLGDPSYTMGFAVEAIWFDTFVHADDIRAALGEPPVRGPGMQCAVHHVAGYLDRRGWGPATLALEGQEPVQIGGSGGPEITGDPLAFVLAATGRADPNDLGLDPSVVVYAD